MKQWHLGKSDDFSVMFVAILINNLLSFVMNIFAIYMLEKMSKATWTVDHKDSREAKQTTQMDREVAAGWFDYMMPIKDYVFRQFTYNIPPCDESLASDRSSNISSSRRSSVITLEEDNAIADSQLISLADSILA